MFSQTWTPFQNMCLCHNPSLDTTDLTLWPGLWSWSGVDEAAQVAVQADRCWTEQIFLVFGWFCSRVCSTSKAKLSTSYKGYQRLSASSDQHNHGSLPDVTDFANSKIMWWGGLLFLCLIPLSASILSVAAEFLMLWVAHMATIISKCPVRWPCPSGVFCRVQSFVTQWVNMSSN